MPILALSQNYHTRRNIPYQDNATQLGMMRSVCWSLKAALKGEITTGTTGSNSRVASTLWTHVRSCDSTTTSTVTDLWGTTYTPSALVWNNDGSAHSWIQLRNAALGMDLVLALPTTSTNAILAAMVPTSFGFSGGSTTTRPINATFEVCGGYTYANTGAWVAWQGDTTTGLTNFMHFTVGADGSFYFTTTRLSLGCASSFFGIQKPQSTTSWPANVSDTNNVQLILPSGTTSPAGVGVFSFQNLLSQSGNCIALLPNSTRVNSGGVFHDHRPGATQFCNSAMPTDAYGLEFPVMPLPILQWSTTSNQSAVRGVLRDWWLHPNRASIPNGQTNDPGAVINHVVFGDHFLPWNGSSGPTF